MKTFLFILTLSWCVLCPMQAQKKGSVSLQSALNDSTFFNVRLSYAAAGKGTLTLTSAYLTRRGSLKRTPVETSNLNYEFPDGPTAVSFLFSMNFVFEKRRYRAHGSYAESSDGLPDCILRCVPMRLSDKTLRESEYQNHP